MKGLREILPPYSVNAWAAAALPAAIADTAYRDWYIAQAAESRALLAAASERHGLRTWPSAANFVLIDFGGRERGIAEAMAQLGFAVRDKSDEPSCRGCVRVTAGLVDDTRLFIGALEELLCGVRR